MKWVVAGALAATAESKGRLLVIQLLNVADEWSVVAVETRNGVSEASEVFDDHRHEDLGRFRALAPAMRAAEKYLRTWYRKKGDDRCNCEDLELDHAADH
jgi:hypothetical protein